MNTRIAQSLDNFVDVMWTPKDKFTLIKTLREDWKSISPSIK